MMREKGQAAQQGRSRLIQPRGLKYSYFCCVPALPQSRLIQPSWIEISLKVVFMVSHARRGLYSFIYRILHRLPIYYNLTPIAHPQRHLKYIRRSTMNDEERKRKKIIPDIITNYQQLESSIVEQLYMKHALHGTTIGTEREEVWSQVFGSDFTQKVCDRTLCFIIDSQENVSHEG